MPRRWPSILPERTPPAPPPPRRRPQAGSDYPTTVTESEELPIYGFLGWRQHHVVHAMEELEYGVMALPHQLHLAMLKDPEYRHGMETRVRGLVNTDFAWHKADAMPQKIYDEFCARWPDVWDENELASATRQRISMGVAPAHAVWTFDGDLDCWMPRRLRVRDTGNLTWFPVERRYKIVTLDRGMQTCEDDADPWLLFSEMASEYPHLHGAQRALASWWWLKQEMATYEALYGRTCAVPIKQVEGPAEQRSPTDGRPDYQHLMRLAARLENNQVFPAPIIDEIRRFKMSLIEAKGEAHKVLDVFMERVDKYITLILLGGIDNTQGGRDGSRARADTHQKQTNMYLGADCKITARTLSRFARRWVRFNGWPATWAPIPKFADQPLADQTEMAEAAKGFGTAIHAFATANGNKLPDGIDIRATAERCGIVYPRTAGEQIVSLSEGP